MTAEDELGRVTSASATSNVTQTWIHDRAFGLGSLVCVTVGQLLLVLLGLFAPDEPASILERADRLFETHWTDDLTSWWKLCSLIAGVLAIIGLAWDKRRNAAAIALAAAFVGFAWPWALAFG